MEYSTFFTLAHFHLADLLQTLSTQGVTSIPLLTDRARQALEQEAYRYLYSPEDRVVGTGDRIVRQEYSSFTDFPTDSLYIRLTQAFQALLDDALVTIEPSPFTTALAFNSMVLQRYEPGQLGITPHRDSLRAINLICLFNISGQAQFCRCDDRQGRHSVEIDTTPGHVIFMRAPGFLGSQERPFHYLSNIRSTRLSFGLRQRESTSSRPI